MDRAGPYRWRRRSCCVCPKCRRLRRGPQFRATHGSSRRRDIGHTLRGEEASTNDTVAAPRPRPRDRGPLWTLSVPIAIDQLVKQAMEHNRSLVASKATLAQAQELALAQRAHGTASGPHRPVSVVSSTGRKFLGGFGKIPPLHTSPVGPAVSYTLDYTGGVRAAWSKQYALA